MDSKRNWLAIAFVLAALLLVFILTRAHLEIQNEILALPILAFFSFYRMFFAYIISLFFALIYGYYAATNHRARRILLPILDILQSVPILGFFPAALFFFITTFNGANIGIEFATIFLIFTSMAWNMTFGVYESILSIPKDVNDATKSFGLKRFLLFKDLILPATIPKLVYNSMISWAAGWYYLIASEIISIGANVHRLPGLGSYLVETSARGDIPDMLAGLFVLIAIIISMDLLLWRPLTIWSEKFKYESVKGAKPRSRVYQFYKWTPALISARKAISRIYDLVLADMEKASMAIYDLRRKNAMFRRLMFTAKWVLIVMFFWYLVNWLIGLADLAYSIVSEPLPSKAYDIPMALLLSFLRVMLAFVISLIWTVPAAIIIMRNPKYQAAFVPFFEIAAAIPAPALYPIIILLSLWLFNSFEVATILLVMTGMQWYLLFNAMAGVKSLPTDLDEAAASIGLRKSKYYRKVLLPAMLPSLVTGSITAIGGGWNALIVAEYVSFAKCGGGICSVDGIGSFLSKITYDQTLTPDVQGKLLFLSLGAMILAIFLLNHFVWRKIYNYVLKKYRLD